MNPAEDGACAVPHCKTEGALKYRGKWICDSHWLHVANIEDDKGDLAFESQLARWGFPSRSRDANSDQE